MHCKKCYFIPIYIYVVDNKYLRCKKKYIYEEYAGFGINYSGLAFCFLSLSTLPECETPQSSSVLS